MNTLRGTHSHVKMLVMRGIQRNALVLLHTPHEVGSPSGRVPWCQLTIIWRSEMSTSYHVDLEGYMIGTGRQDRPHNRSLDIAFMEKSSSPPVAHLDASKWSYNVQIVSEGLLYIQSIM